MAKKKFVLHFPEESVEKPVTYHLVKDYNLIPNILRAQIDENEGTLVVDLQGSAEQIDKGITFLKDQGVGIQEAIQDLAINRDRCVDCGSCTGVCKPGALAIGPDDWKLDFDLDKCIFCELCINTCPTKAIKVQF